MPKSRPIWTINQPFNAPVSFRGGSSSGGGGGSVSDHGSLSGLADDDHSQYHNDTRGDARYYTQTAIDSWRSTHTGDTDAHHNQVHSITGSDHTLTASQYQVVGATSTNTLGLLTPTYSAGQAGGNPTAILRSEAGALLIGSLGADTLLVTGNSTLQGTLDVSGATDITDTLSVTGSYATTLGGTLGVTGATTLSSTLSVTDDVTVATDVFKVDVGADTVGINGSETNHTLHVEPTAVDDITLYIQRIASQSDNMSMWVDSDDSTLLRVDESGNLESGNYAEGLTGWHLSATGKSQFVDVEVLGTLHAAIFSADEIHTVNGTLMVTAGGHGKLYETVSITETAVDDDPKPSATLKVEDPLVGPIAAFEVGDRLRIKGLGGLPAGTGPATAVYDFPVYTGPDGGNPIIADVWLTIDSYVRGSSNDHTVYTCTVQKAPACTLYKGVTVINYGQFVASPNPNLAGDIAPASITISADDKDYSPVIYMDTMVANDPWNFSAFERHVQIGKIRELEPRHPGDPPFVVHGIRAGVDLNDETLAYAELGSEGLELFKASLITKDETGFTGKIWPNGSFKFAASDGDYTIGGEDENENTIINENGAITSNVDGFQFDSATGDVVIGRYDTSDSTAQWMRYSNGQLELSSSITIPADIDFSVSWEGLSGKPPGTTTMDFNKDPGLKITGHFLGYYDGSNFTTYMDFWGNLFLGGNETVGGSRLQFDAATGLLGGYDSDENIQWSASSSTGKLTAGGGDVVLDSDGVSVESRTGSTYSTSNSYTMTYSGSDVAYMGGRAYGASDYQMVLSATGRTGSAWGTIRLSASSATYGLFDNNDANYGTLLVQPGNVYVGPVVGLIVSDDAGDTGDTATAGTITATGAITCSTLTTTAGTTWDVGAYTAGSTTESGYLTVTVGGSNYRISVEAV